MKIIGLIPARYASVRFPGKPLCPIAGKTMIERVYTNAAAAKSLSEVWVATDDARIYQHVEQFGGRVVMTSENHRSGTDRCAEAALTVAPDAAVVVNIQGDEPFLHPGQIDELTELFANRDIAIGTLVRQISDNADLHNPNIPKVVLGKGNRALYFSRQTIPYIRDCELPVSYTMHPFYSHIGIYAYRLPALLQIVQLPPSGLEVAEKLEQLRWLENGFTIHVALSNYPNLAIDTPEDLEKALQYYQTLQQKQQSVGKQKRR
ncbi:3-deoxy-manno-octulosonate cytidylyltransferase [Sphingobacteriales bacterium UPWRP_1]|nr:3-deoxy-D-manno-octulosonate cytidylyltransferase [Sphingobacteriales bacterium TSM_CSM]PSJ73239.1 3-deoxy-manno-octulosonate cytidylyltransferase [Sphingobacteriales bacterium UPWRP_1]